MIETICGLQKGTFKGILKRGEGVLPSPVVHGDDRQDVNSALTTA